MSEAFNINQVLSLEEKQGLLKKSNLYGFWVVGFDLLFIAALFTLVAWYPSPLTIIPALILLGGRQLSLIIIMHECAHYSLFKSRALNQFFGQWLGAAPFMNDLDLYREYHNRHHKFTGVRPASKKDRRYDPDIGLLRFYPVSKKAFYKRIWHDLTLRTGLRSYFGLAMMLLGVLQYDLSGRVIRLKQAGRSPFRWIFKAIKAWYRFFIVHGILFAACFFSGYWWLYLLWWGAALSTNMVYIRIRAMAEHCLLEATPDQLLNTRTTYAGPLARLTVAPHWVNYHLEHHMLMAVPARNLRRFHQLLKERGVLNNSPVATGYLQVIRAAYSQRRLTT